ncbi:MAG: TetR/AcrR family transcriptional regulator [Acidimicrobiales bacterium]
MSSEARERVLGATVTCAGHVGLSKVTVEDVAREARLSRATVYRYFPGGREQLVDEAITWEVGQFFARLAAAVEDETDFESRLVRALLFGHRAIAEHDVLQRELESEPGSVLPQLQETTPLLLGVTRDFLRERLGGERLRPGVDPDEAADYLARMVLSYISTGGGWDLDDPDEVRRLVRTQFLAGVLVDPEPRMLEG